MSLFACRGSLTDARTPDQRRHYDARLKWELDENTRIQTAFEEGEASVRIELIRTLENLHRHSVDVLNSCPDNVCEKGSKRFLAPAFGRTVCI